VTRYPGEEIARGSRSSVRAWGADAVAKVPLPTTPDGWIIAEAHYTADVHATGAPVPRLLAIERVEGRAASIYERAHGPSMWELVTSSPSTAAAVGADLAALHDELLGISPPPTLPRQVDRMACKIRRAASSVAADVAEALALLPAEVGLYRLCHGDLHPGNVLVTPRGPVVIDWFDASRGDPTLDVARTALLLGVLGPRLIRPVHLPGATLPVLKALYEAYRRGILERTGFIAGEIDRHGPSTWAARLAEGLERDDLIEAWRRSRHETAN
jgi:aminoglycoside phosphotransferase (APT) family kinase protein